MKQKDIGLLISICVLAFLAVFSDKSVKVTQDYYVTPAELKLGREIFRGACRKCHGRGSRSGAPPIDSSREWDGRLHQGMDTLVEHALNCMAAKGRIPVRERNPSITREEAEAAVAYIVLESR